MAIVARISVQSLNCNEGHCQKTETDGPRANSVLLELDFHEVHILKYVLFDLRFQLLDSISMR